MPSRPAAIAVDDPPVCRAYTAAMLAALVGVPAATIRHWQRRGTLVPVRVVGRLAYYGFDAATAARQLAELVKAGCSLKEIDRQLAALARQGATERPLDDPAVVVEGKRLLRRVGEGLAEPHGQLRFGFADGASDALDHAALAESPHVISMKVDSVPVVDLADLQQRAIDAEADDDLPAAAECYRALLLAGAPAEEWNFALADALYRLGDLPAARERYYAAIEGDEQFVEARLNLGCVLAELGDDELAAATFAGALAFHADYADAHFQRALALERLDRDEEAAQHFRRFLELAPESPWADAARERLDAVIQ